MRAIPVVTLSFVLPMSFAPLGLLAAQHLGKGNPIDAASRDNSSVDPLALNTALKNSGKNSGVPNHSFVPNSVKSRTPLAVSTSNQTSSKIRQSPSRTAHPSSSIARFDQSSSKNKLKISPDIINQVIDQSLAINPAKKLPASETGIPAPVSHRANLIAQLMAPANDGNKRETQVESVVKSSPFVTHAIAQNPTRPAQNSFLPALPSVENQPQPPVTVPPQVNPTQTIGVDEAYVLGPGDAILLKFFNVPEYNNQYQIMVDGTVNLPLVGNTLIAGMTLKQASDAISARYVKELEYPIVTVNLVQPRAFQIAVAGEISQPGLYALPAAQGGQFATVAQAVQAAGGVTQAADLKRVEVRRRERTGVTRTTTVNLLELLQNGDLSQNTTLRDGDTIFIPAATEINLAETNQLAVSNLRANTNQLLNVAVVGEVARPGPYRLGGTNGQPTLIQALQLAGGITPSANLRQIQVRRQTRQGNAQEIKIDLWQVLQTGNLSQDLVLQPGDTVTIPAAANLTSNQIASLASSSLSTGVIRTNIVGEVKVPGRLELQSNTTLNQAVLAAGGFNGRSNKDVKLIRFNPNGTVTQQKIKIDLSQGLDAQNNPILRNNDVIVVGRSTGAKLKDTLSDVMGVLGMPLRLLF